MPSGCTSADAMREMRPSRESPHRQNLGVLPARRPMSLRGLQRFLWEKVMICMVCGSLHSPLSSSLAITCVSKFPTGILSGRENSIEEGHQQFITKARWGLVPHPLAVLSLRSTHCGHDATAKPLHEGYDQVGRCVCKWKNSASRWTRPPIRGKALLRLHPVSYPSCTASLKVREDFL